MIQRLSPSGERRAAIEAGRDLRPHLGTAPFHARHETGIERPRLGFENARRRTAMPASASAARRPRPPSDSDRTAREHHAAYARALQCLRARRRAALMAAGLQRHVGRGARRPGTRLRQRDRLGMRPAGALVPALADQLARRRR